MAPHAPLLMPSSGFKGPVVHLHGLTGLRIVGRKSRLGYLYQYAWRAWTAQECSLMLGYKLDISCCTNKDGFSQRQAHKIIIMVAYIKLLIGGYIPYHSEEHTCFS